MKIKYLQGAIEVPGFAQSRGDEGEASLQPIATHREQRNSSELCLLMTAIVPKETAWSCIQRNMILRCDRENSRLCHLNVVRK